MNKNLRNIVVYVSGKYTGKDADEVRENITNARTTAILVWEAGFCCICPHTNTIFFEKDCLCTYDDYMAGDLELVNRCDALLMLDNWLDSKGAKIEHEHAKKEGKLIFYSIQELREYYR